MLFTVALTPSEVILWKLQLKLLWQNEQEKTHFPLLVLSVSILSPIVLDTIFETMM
jgi:hypothetical protein